MLRPHLAIIAIMAVAAGLRLLNLGLIRVSYDDSYPAYDALRMLDGRQLVLLGQPSSVFLDNPALMGYLQAIPLLFQRSPWAVHIAIVLLNTVAVWFVYRAARDVLGQTVALLSTLLFSANPWVVYFSRTTWVQSLLPFFTAVIAWGLWPGMVTDRRSPRRVLAAGLALAATTQTYVQAWGMMAQVVPLVILFRRRLSRRALLAGLAVVLLATAGYALALSRNWDAGRADLRRFAAGQVNVTRAGLNHALRLVTGRDFEYVYTRSEAGDYPRRRALSIGAHYLLTLALAAGGMRAVAALRRPGQPRRAAIVLLLWIGAPIALMSPSAQPVHPHYLLLTLPAGHLLAGWGIEPLLRRRWVRAPVLAALLLVASLFALNLRRANDSVAAQPTAPTAGEWALGAGSLMGRQIRELTAGSSRPPRVASDENGAVLSNLSGVLVRTLPGLAFPDYIVLPGQEPLLYVLINSTPDAHVLGPLCQAFPERDLQFADGTRVSFLLAPPYSREGVLALPQVPIDWPSEAGLSILGYSMDGTFAPGQSVTCTTFWRADQLDPGRGQWYVGTFYHLLDADGDTLVNVGGRAQWGYHWQLGDAYVQRARIPVPADLAPGHYSLEVGLFDTIQGKNYSLIGPQGWLYALNIPLTVVK